MTDRITMRTRRGERETPPNILAALYRQDAAAYALAANQVSGDQLHKPKTHLQSHAAELMLKAFLLENGWSGRALTRKAVRHNLKELLKEATAAGLSVSEDTKTTIGQLSQAHGDDGDYWNRYGRLGISFNAPRHLIDQAVQELLSVAARPT